MPYNIVLIRENTISRWEGDDFCLLRYVPKRLEKETETTRLILDFKRDNPEAVQVAVSLLVSAIKGMEAEFRDKRLCRYVLAIPPSSAGRPRPSAERACFEIADTFNWLTYLRGALIRASSLQKSATSPPEERPTYEDHIRTISYNGPRIPAGDNNILMFDDILTKGTTSKACRDILKQATGCNLVTGLYLGRTEWIQD
jgi:hypothetical protein